MLAKTSSKRRNWRVLAIGSLACAVLMLLALVWLGLFPRPPDEPLAWGECLVSLEVDGVTVPTSSLSDARGPKYKHSTGDYTRIAWGPDTNQISILAGDFYAIALKREELRKLGDHTFKVKIRRSPFPEKMRADYRAKSKYGERWLRVSEDLGVDGMPLKRWYLSGGESGWIKGRFHKEGGWMPILLKRNASMLKLEYPLMDLVIDGEQLNLAASMDVVVEVEIEPPLGE